MKRRHCYISTYTLSLFLALTGLLYLSPATAGIDRSLCDEKGHFVTPPQALAHEPMINLHELIASQKGQYYYASTENLREERQALQKTLDELLITSGRTAKR